jgi:four helix bundle protein
MGFERLRVYQAAQQLDEEIRTLLEGVPRGHGRDVRHLKASAGSVLFNIAEAFGSELGKKRHHLEIARGEADEVRAALRRLVGKAVLTERQIRRACELTSVIAKMLTAWINTLE